MKFLYVAPRYHTNQIPIMKGLKEAGHTVAFFSHYAGRIEDYSYVTPEIIGYSPLFRLIDDLYVKVLHKNDPKAADWKLIRGFPPIIKMNRRLKEYMPDVVIIRERSIYSMAVYLLCQIHRFKTILYNQSPVYGEEKKDMMHKLVRKLTPKVRMTPVMGTPGKEKIKEPDVFFVPFIMDLKLAPEERSYCPDGKVRIFTVGKYEKRKNLLMIAKIVRELSEKYNIHLTIAGECTTKFHKAYYEELEKYIEDHHLKDQITLFQNLNRDEMEKNYKNADLFVLPSTLEPASISQLEAMAFSVPVICSDTNGSACYVETGHNGFLFKDNEEESLKEMMEQAIKSPELLEDLGKNSYHDVQEKYQFTNYFKGIMECIHCLEK